MTREEERGVIDRILQGDANAFEVLVVANQRSVYNVCLRMTKNQEDAYDLSQEAFLRAYNSLGSFKGESSFSAWLYRLASNICIDFLRREKRRDNVSLTYEDDAGSTLELELPDERFSPVSALERREMAEYIRAGLNTLTEEHRQILTMREIDGLRYDEIAVVLGVSAGTVKSRISRARQSLVKFLSANGNFSIGESSNRQVERREV